MRSLPLPDRSKVREHLVQALEVFNWAGEQKGYPVTEQELDEVLELYDLYDAAGGVPNEDLKGDSLEDALSQAIKDGYRFTQQRGKLSGIRTDLFKGVSHCPICGISPPRDLDHYLPESIFRPLAIYVWNLVPYCHDCNHSKGAHDQSEEEKRFFHPYFDVLPEFQFVRASVALDNSALLVDFYIDPWCGLDDALYARLSYQFKRLKLGDRFRAELNSYLTGHTTALVWAFEAQAETGVKSFLQHQANVERGAFHPNHWRPVLLSALSDHDEFCLGGFKNVLPVAYLTGLKA